MTGDEVADGAEVRPYVSLIVAMARNGVIGRDGGLPWHLSADLKRFKALTMGHHIIMGRKTWESIGRPLPGRTSIVITRNRSYAASGAQVADSLSSALRLARGDAEAFIIGGGQIYRDALALADRIYLTEVDADAAGDTFFPSLDRSEWRVAARERGEAKDDEPGWDFVVYERMNLEPGRR